MDSKEKLEKFIAACQEALEDSGSIDQILEVMNDLNLASGCHTNKDKQLLVIVAQGEEARALYQVYGTYLDISEAISEAELLKRKANEN